MYIYFQNILLILIKRAPFLSPGFRGSVAECQFRNQKVTGWIPDQDTCPCCWLNPQLGGHIGVSPSMAGIVILLIPKFHICEFIYLLKLLCNPKSMLKFCCCCC